MIKCIVPWNIFFLSFFFFFAAFAHSHVIVSIIYGAYISAFDEQEDCDDDVVSHRSLPKNESRKQLANAIACSNSRHRRLFSQRTNANSTFVRTEMCCCCLPFSLSVLCFWPFSVWVSAVKLRSSWTHRKKATDDDKRAANRQRNIHSRFTCRRSVCCLFQFERQ